MPTIPIGLAGGTYLDPSKVGDNQRTVNWRPEKIESERGLAKVKLKPVEGLRLMADKSADVGVGPCRGLAEFIMSDGVALCIAVLGTRVYIGTTWTGQDVNFNLHATVINSNSLPVTFNCNMIDQIMIISAGNSYVYSYSANTLTQIVDPDLPIAPSGSHVAALLDQFTALLRSGQRQFFITLGDVTAWDALDFTTVESEADSIIAVIENRSELWFFGRKKLTVYFNSGDFDFTFDRRPGAIIEFGLLAPSSVAKKDQMIFALGQDDNGNPRVVKFTSYQPQRISDNALEDELKRYAAVYLSDPSNNGLRDAVGFVIDDEYWLQFPMVDRTWVYNMSSGLWYERLFWDVTSAQYQRHRVMFHAYFGNRHIVGDRASALLYELSPTTYTDNGQPIRKLRRCTHLSKPGTSATRLAFNRLLVVTETGNGLNVAAGQPGYDPVLTLEYSDNAGQTFSDPIDARTGQIGVFNEGAEWRQLGSCNSQRTFQITSTEPLQQTLIEAYADVEEL